MKYNSVFSAQNIHMYLWSPTDVELVEDITCLAVSSHVEDRFGFRNPKKIKLKSPNKEHSILKEGTSLNYFPAFHLLWHR